MRAYRRFATRPLPRTEQVYERILCLPIFNEIRDADVDEVCGQVSAHFRSPPRPQRAVSAPPENKSAGSVPRAIRLGVWTSYLNLGVTWAIQLLMVPLLLGHLGAQTYGLYADTHLGRRLLQPTDLREFADRAAVRGRPRGPR